MREELEAYSSAVIDQKNLGFHFYKVRPYLTESGVRLDYGSDTEYPLIRSKEKGFYFIYDDPTVYPVYVGRGVVDNRIYRFFKELLGKSREDEGHPGAKRYKQSQENWDVKALIDINWHVQIVWDDEIKITPTEEVYKYADDRVAELLRSRYNRQTVGKALDI